MNQAKQTTARFADLPDEAYIRLKHLLNQQLVPYSASTLWRKCRKKEFPSPIKVSAGITAWRVGDVRRYLKSIGAAPEVDQ
jgi:prophage regulatory protein